MAQLLSPRAWSRFWPSPSCRFRRSGPGRGRAYFLKDGIAGVDRLGFRKSVEARCPLLSLEGDPDPVLAVPAVGMPARKGGKLVFADRRGLSGCDEAALGEGGQTEKALRQASHSGEGQGASLRPTPCCSATLAAESSGAATTSDQNFRRQWRCLGVALVPQAVARRRAV